MAKEQESGTPTDGKGRPLPRPISLPAVPPPRIIPRPKKVPEGWDEA